MTTGQILLNSPFGKRLNELAGSCDSILEIGTWRGLGSTFCLASGMKSGGWMVSIEANGEMVEEAKLNLAAFKFKCDLELHYGILHRNIKPFFHPVDHIQNLETWQAEERMAREVPLIDIIWNQGFDLILLDGGEFTSEGDLDVLIDQANMIALDDCNPKLSVKNWNNFVRLNSNPDWTLIDNNPDDRYGWAIFKRNK